MKPQVKTLLHIDEHQEDRLRLKHSLLKELPDLELHEANSGLEAIRHIGSLRVDCVVLDLKLRDIVGTELIRLIQFESRDKPIPIIIWTGLTHDMLKQATLSLGITHHFLKRRDEQEVVLAILRALA